MNECESSLPPSPTGAGEGTDASECVRSRSSGATTSIVYNVTNAYTPTSSDSPSRKERFLGYDLKSDNWEYTGETEDGKPHGHGKKIWASSVGSTTTHIGGWKNGKEDGAGIRIWGGGGGRLSGEWRNGSWAYGTYCWPNGDRYVGEFKGNKRHGHGVFNYSNGDRYEGEWKSDIKDGKGRYIYKNGTCYEGPWKYNHKSGHGVMRYENGDRYDGNWRQNQKCGSGDYYYSTGNIYNGEWLFDKKHGKGRFIYAHGDIFEGEYQMNKRHGHGLYRYEKGDVYSGSWFNDIKEGNGIYWYGYGEFEGDCYIGDWFNGKKHGQGLYIWKDGRYYEGSWEENKRLGPIVTPTESEVRKVVPEKPEIAEEWEGLATFKSMMQVMQEKCDRCGRAPSEFINDIPSRFGSRSRSANAAVVSVSISSMGGVLPAAEAIHPLSAGDGSHTVGDDSQDETADEESQEEPSENAVESTTSEHQSAVQTNFSETVATTGETSIDASTESENMHIDLTEEIDPPLVGDGSAAEQTETFEDIVNDIEILIGQTDATND